MFMVMIGLGGIFDPLTKLSSGRKYVAAAAAAAAG